MVHITSESNSSSSIMSKNYAQPSSGSSSSSTAGAGSAQQGNVQSNANANQHRVPANAASQQHQQQQRPTSGASASSHSNRPHHPHGNPHHHSSSHHQPYHHHHGGHPHHPNYSQSHQQQQQQQQQPRPIQPYHQPKTNQENASSSDSFDFRIFESIDYPFCTDHSKYEHVAKIGQGTFGEVYKSKCKRTNEFVALKKVLTENEKEGFPITALREIKILQVLRHENIVRLIEICTTKATAANKFKSQFYLVFEFCEHDLAGLLSNPMVKFTLGEQKKIMQQLLNGLYYIHKNFILHRDMKTANILVTKEGKLKLADFGLARAIEQQKFENQAARYTNRVVTLWYRPPELLLGERCYNKAIDMWGAGCIMAELWTRDPILKGNTEQNQLELIQSLCGPITTEVWPEVDKLELFHKMQLKNEGKRRIKERLGVYIKDQFGLDLLDKLLTLDPKKRIDSDEALDHDFFWTEPMPSDLKLDKLSSSMFEYTAPSRRGQFQRQPVKALGNEQHHDRVY